MELLQDTVFLRAQIWGGTAEVGFQLCRYLLRSPPVKIVKPAVFIAFLVFLVDSNLPAARFRLLLTHN